ncbi:MAG: zf-TFIIB domain-containing protein, partial [Sedimentisphaerales bacterium]|nr:zf-TFIIB domain-containing protein [Sedimentisphaerales bacterium]
MNCPACQEPMIVLELDEVEIDYCTVCNGVWLDGGELEVLLGDEDQAKKLLKSFSEDRITTETSRRCPLCRKKMKKVRVGADKDAPLIDKCPQGEGLWFDQGELATVIERGSI